MPSQPLQLYQGCNYSYIQLSQSVQQQVKAKERKQRSTQLTDWRHHLPVSSKWKQRRENKDQPSWGTDVIIFHSQQQVKAKERKQRSTQLKDWLHHLPQSFHQGLGVEGTGEQVQLLERGVDGQHAQDAVSENSQQTVVGVRRKKNQVEHR